MAKRFLKELAAFFNPRDWVPDVPLPPVGSWEPKGEGCMSVWEALFGKEE